MSQSLRVHQAARLLIDDLIVLVDDAKDVLSGFILPQRHREGGENIISVVKHHNSFVRPQLL